MLTNCRSCRI